MERKPHFESDDDVKAYFAAQIELWDKPKPHPPQHFWEQIEDVHLLNARRPGKARHPIAKPNFSRLEFPTISKQPSTHRVKTIHKIAEAPRIRASPRKIYELRKISSLRDLLATRWHET